jgi:hypothetical protein
MSIGHIFLLIVISKELSFIIEMNIWNSETPFLVIINHYDHDVSWVERLNFPHVIYYKDRPDKEPFSAVNKAKSETNLLKFISDFYDNLPENIIVVHQYERKFYHDGSLVDLLNDPNFKFKYEESKTKGFWNFNTQFLGSITPQIERITKSGWWDNCMRKYFGPIQSCGDFTNGKKGCAQFVVSRDRIRSLPQEFYKHMYDWTIENTLDEEITSYDPITLCRQHSDNWDHPNSSHYISRYLEWTWELIFSSWKPSEDISVTLSNGRKLSVVYGAGNYYRDVTSIFVDNFVTPIGSIVFPRQSLNQHFGDVVSGTLKNLRITLDDKIVEIDEGYNLIIR